MEIQEIYVYPLKKKLILPHHSMASTGFREIISSIRKNNIAPVYILMGEESYYIDEITSLLEQSVIMPQDRDFNQNTYYGIETEIETVIGCAQQFPVMADRKLVVLREAQTMQHAKTQLDKITSYLLKPNPTTVLVIAFKGDKLSADLIKKAEKGGAVIFKSNTPRDYEVPMVLKDYCQARKVGIDEKAVSMLCDYIGTPLSKLFGEVNKLIQIKGGSGNRITPEDVERNIGISKDYNNFEFTKALCSRDYAKSIAIVRYFSKNPKDNPTVVTTAILFNFFSRLVIAHFLPEKTDMAIMQALELKNSYALREIKDGMRSYPPVKAINAIHHLRDFDTKSKGVRSFQKEGDLLQELVFKIMT